MILDQDYQAESSEDDEKEYHTDEDGELILDEYGEPIESYICLCFAKSEFECMCGAWNVPIPTRRD